MLPSEGSTPSIPGFVNWAFPVPNEPNAEPTWPKVSAPAVGASAEPARANVARAASATTTRAKIELRRFGVLSLCPGLAIFTLLVLTVVFGSVRGHPCDRPEHGCEHRGNMQ